MSASTIFTLVTILLGSNWLGNFFLELYRNRRKDKKEDPMAKMQKQIDELHTVIVKLNNSLDKNSELTISHARDRLNWLCNKYKELGFVPEDDYVAFKLLGEAYISAGGNHGFDEKFNYIINNYQKKSTKEIIEEGLCK